MILQSELTALVGHVLALFILILGLRQLRKWPAIFALLILPGTIAHELLHFVIGLITGAQPAGFSVLPKRQHNGTWQLGEVTFTNLRWWNSVPVALAPLALLPLGCWLFFHSAALPALSSEGAIWKLIAAQCFLTGWPSPRDWSHAFNGFVIIAVLSAAIGWGLVSTGLIKI